MADLRNPEVPTPADGEPLSSSLVSILAGIVLGIAAAVVFKGQCAEIAFIGDLFLRLLQMVVLPMVVVSLVCGVTSLGDIARMGRVGSWTALYFLMSTWLAISLGLFLVTTLKPGVGKGGVLKPTTSQMEAAQKRLVGKEDTAFKTAETAGKFRAVFEFLKDFITRRAIPSNLFKSAADGDLLPLIFFSAFFGFSLALLGERGAPLVRLFEDLNTVIMFMVHKIIGFAPLGIFALVASKVGVELGKGTFQETLILLGSYVGCVLAGLGIHFFIFQPLMLFFIAGKNPLLFYRGLAPALFNAFSTASSNATIPLNIQCCEENLGISRDSARFVIPLGATVNMNGTALYEAVAVVFIAQVSGIDLTPLQLFLVFITSTMAAIGAAGIPEAGLVTMVMVLEAVNLPYTESVALILVVDWFLDRCRTTVNVMDDAIGAAIVDRQAMGDRVNFQASETPPSE